MKEINKMFFEDNKYKDKIYSVTNLRLLSFEIYKFFLLYLFIIIISKLSHIFPLNFFFEMNFNFYSLIKIFIYYLTIDICYFILFKYNTGIKSFPEFIISLIVHPNIIKLISMSISFSLIFISTKEFKSLMPRLEFDYIKNKYDLDNYSEEEENERYKEYNKFYNSDFLYDVIISCLLFSCMIFDLEKFNLWPKLQLSRINFLKNKLASSLMNIIIIGIPSFLLIYFFLIFFYHTLFVFDLSLNYASLFIFEYNILYLSLKCIKNFICSPINYITNEINTTDKLIKKEINFLKEDNFYICHHLQQLRDLYEYPRDIKYNINLLSHENLNCLKKKLNFFTDSINKKYQLIYTKKSYYYINPNGDFIDKIRIFFGKIRDLFDFSANQIIQKDTSVQNIKFAIEITGNIILFISDAKINKINEEKYNEYKEYSYYFTDKLIDINTLLVNLIQNKKISENLKKNLQKLRYIIKNYLDVVKYKQMKNKFLKLISQKIQSIL